MDSLRNQAAIVGYGETPLGKVPGINTLQFHALAMKAALDDCGMARDEIDGLLCPEVPGWAPSMAVAEYLGIRPRWTTSMAIGGATHCAMVNHAAAAVASGLANNVLIVTGASFLSNSSTKVRFGPKPVSDGGRDARVAGMASLFHPQWEVPYGPLLPSYYALAAARHMHEYGTTPEQLAEISVAIRGHAALNPGAMYRTPITVEDVLNSRLISTPLHILECSIISDGGAALIVTSAERAHDYKKPPIWLLGAGEGHTHANMTAMEDLTVTGAKRSGETAFRMAGLTPADIDVAEIYDCFTITVLLLLEDLGFCPKGEGGRFVENGRIRLGGELPVTTHGGALSHGHPGGPSGIFHITEAIKQLRGEVEMPERQVPNCEIALCHGNGGVLSTESTIILGNEKA